MDIFRADFGELENMHAAERKDEKENQPQKALRRQREEQVVYI